METASANVGRGELLWEPSPERVERATMTRYMRWLAAERGRSFDDYGSLWRWSVSELEEFWRSIWDFFSVEASSPHSSVLTERAMPGARWFAGSELSYPQHIFRDRSDDALAIVHASELRGLDELSWGTLRAQVAQVAAGLRELGVGPGDRVVAYLPNIPETVIAFLAAASIGAVWSSCSPDFGARSVVDRFAQVEPKVMLAIDGYRYGGRDFDRIETVAGLAREMPTLVRTVVLPYLTTTPDLSSIQGAISWEELMAAGDGAALQFEQVPFDHPLWVLYSSGTTGLPKAIVHGHGGILLEHLKKLHLHVDAQADERVFWFTTTGWMMWNFLVGCLLTPAPIVLYDGSPGHPDMGALWDLAERAGITCFGTSASYLAACMKAGVEPAAGRDLTHLRSVGSTGSPLSPEAFAWVYEQLGRDTWLFSTSGGTGGGTAVIYGRSDSTINRQGVRMGTSEIYRAVQSVPEVVDALVVDVPRPGTEGWMPLFCVLADGVTLDDELEATIKQRIRDHCSPRHVPQAVFQIAEVPRTLSGKILEVPVKRILMGTPPDQAASRDSLANPAALDYFVGFAARLERET